MRKFINKIARLARNHPVIAALAAVMIIAAPATVMAAWGPDRIIYDYSSTDPAIRNGSFDGPRFNSYINTPSYGDERNFVTVSEAGKAVWRDEVTADPGEEVEIRAYIHNAAHEDTNGENFDGIGVARDTKVRFYVPGEASHGFDVAGYVSASNAKPSRVYDTAVVKSKSGQNVSLEYVKGSAKLYNNGPFKNGTAVNDSLVAESGDGALIGWDAMDGVFPGCFRFDAVVIIKVKVVAPELEVEKTVSKVEKPSRAEGLESVSVKRGDTVTWRIDYKNVGTARIDDVTIRDNLPAGLTLVPNSITIADASRPTGKQLPDTALTSGGVNVGSYTEEGNGVVRFRTVVNKDFKECEIKNIVFVKGKDVKEVSDDAKVVIEDCKPVTPPVTTTLPVTGPGEVVGMFVATTVAAGLAHKFVLSRRYQ